MYEVVLAGETISDTQHFFFVQNTFIFFPFFGWFRVKTHELVESGEFMGLSFLNELSYTVWAGSSSIDF